MTVKELHRTNAIRLPYAASFKKENLVLSRKIEQQGAGQLGELYRKGPNRAKRMRASLAVVEHNLWRLIQIQSKHRLDSAQGLPSVEFVFSELLMVLVGHPIGLKR